MKTIMLEGYGSYSGKTAEAMLIGTNGKHIILRGVNPLNPKGEYERKLQAGGRNEGGFFSREGFYDPS